MRCSFFSTAAWLLCATIASADCLEGSRLATPAELQFRERVLTAVKAAIPVPAAFAADRNETNLKEPFSRCLKDPMEADYNVTFRRSLTREEETAVKQQGAAAATASAGDKAEFDRLSQEVQAIGQKMTEAVRAGKNEEVKRLTEQLSALQPQLEAAMKRNQAAYRGARSAEQFDRTIEIHASVNVESGDTAGAQSTRSGAALVTTQEGVSGAARVRTVTLYFGPWQLPKSGTTLRAALKPNQALTAQTIVVRIKGDPQRVESLLRGTKTEAIAHLLPQP